MKMNMIPNILAASQSHTLSRAHPFIEKRARLQRRTRNEAPVYQRTVQPSTEAPHFAGAVDTVREARWRQQKKCSPVIQHARRKGTCSAADC